MKYKIADIVVEINARFNLLETRISRYQAKKKEEKVNLKIDINEEHIQKMKEITNENVSSELMEYIEAGRIFYKNLLNYQGCLLHASAVVIDEEAYLFSAHCGTGKSTHTSLWLKYLADKKPYILNDDKPAIRILEDGIYAYGTPFSGKHDMSENKRVKLKAICFMEQATTNSIKKIETKEAIKLFFEQTIRKLKEEEMIKFLDILDKILKEVPIYKLSCDMSEEAVQLSYNTMRGGNTNEN